MVNNKNKLIIAGLILMVLILLAIGLADKKPEKQNVSNNQQKAPPVISSEQKSRETYSDEEEKIVLNFKDNQVVIKGYPLIAKDYVKIFHYVYLGMGEDEDKFVEEEVSVDQKGSYSYKLSSTDNRIFTGVGKSESGKPIKQTMEIVPIENLDKLTLNCQMTDVNINGLTAKTIDCPDLTTPACWVAVDEKFAIFYKQYSDEKISGNMCQVLQKNGVRSISFQAYQ